MCKKDRLDGVWAILEKDRYIDISVHTQIQCTYYYSCFASYCHPTVQLYSFVCPLKC